MKILMLTNVVAPDKLGGLERYVRELSASLVKAGVAVTVAAKRTSPGQPGEEHGSDGVRIVRYDVPSKRDPSFAIKYPSRIASGVRAASGPFEGAKDVVTHGHFPVPMLPFLTGRKRPYVYTCHAPVYKEIASERQGSYFLPGPIEAIAVNGMRAVERRVVRRASRVVTLSEFIRAEVAQLDPRVGDRVELVPGGIDLDRFFVRSGARSPRELSGRGPVVFAARRMVLRTGVEQLVAAFDILRRSGIDARLVLAGDGPRRSAIEAFVRENGLHESVHLLGRVSDEELVSWYQSAHIAVTPTQELEGFGLSTAEAMACGAAPLVTPVGANEEVVRALPPQTVTAGVTAQQIADGLSVLLADGDLVRNVRHDAPGAARRFGWGAVTDHHIALYEDQLRMHA